MDDIVQTQTLASGYLPGLSEAGGTLGAPPTNLPTSGKYQNCTVARTAGNAVGAYDITVGGNGPSPVGLGSELALTPPLAVALGNTCPEGRVRVQQRSILRGAGVGTVAEANIAVLYGAQLTPPQPQLVRLLVTGRDGAADVDLDFTIDRVIDPTQV